MQVKIEGWKAPGANEVEMATVIALYRHGNAAKVPVEELSAYSARARLTEWLAVPKTGCLIARSVTGAVEGLLVLRNEPPAARVLFVVAREHRHGVGTALLRGLGEIAGAKGVTEIRTTYAPADARARAFFTKHLGFQEVAAEADAKQVEARLPIGAASK